MKFEVGAQAVYESDGTTKPGVTMKDQARYPIDLAKAHDYEEIPHFSPCDYLIRESLTASATAYIKINSISNPPLDMSLFYKIAKNKEAPIEKVYIYNTAQPGATLVLVAGGDFEPETDQVVTTITAPVQIKDAAGTTINPASEAGTPTQYEVTLTNADQEYSQALPAGTKKVSIRMRNKALTGRYAWVTGKVDTATPAGPYGTLDPERDIDGVFLTGKTVYLASSTAGAVVEFEVWT